MRAALNPRACMVQGQYVRCEPAGGDLVLVALHGATQIISWRTADGRERLYLSLSPGGPSHYSRVGSRCVFPSSIQRVLGGQPLLKHRHYTHPALGEGHGSEPDTNAEGGAVHAGAERQRRHVGAMASYFAAG
jgi:hypothetical protein